MKRLIAFALATLATLSCTDALKISQNVVKAEMERAGGDAAYLDGLQGKLKWNYTTGLELSAMLDVFDVCGDSTIYKFVEDWYDRMIDQDGAIYKYKKENYSLDHICAGKALFRLYELSGKGKYLLAADRLAEHLDGQPRTSEGAFWHKLAYPDQIWLDGVFMACPFWTEYAARNLGGAAQKAVFEAVTNEFIIAAKHTFDPATGLYRHAWDESGSQFWADPSTGQSAHCWGRALGWYCMAVVDVMDWLPEDTPGRAEVERIFRGIFEELPKWADPETGMWYQVLDQPGRKGNYLESTCSAMFTYACLKGTRTGLLDASTGTYAEELYNKLLSTFVSRDSEGRLQLENCCSVAGLGGPKMRAGDYDYYLSEPVVCNDPKGIGPLIRASLEMNRR